MWLSLGTATAGEGGRGPSERGCLRHPDGTCCAWDSSLRVRGGVTVDLEPAAALWVIPARAGRRTTSESRWRACWSHPCACGAEDPRTFDIPASYESSLRVQGGGRSDQRPTGSPRCHPCVCWVQYASRYGGRGSVESSLRVQGELKFDSPIVDTNVSSLPVRGGPDVDAFAKNAARVIPACAGRAC